MIDVALHRHLQRTGQRLEDTLNLMVLVVAVRLYIEVHHGSIAQALEEMEEHLRRHVAHPFAMEVGMPLQPRATAEVECHRTQTIVHRQGVAVALNATLAAQCLQQTGAQCEGRVFYRVVLVYLEVALGMDGQVDISMFAYLFQHMVEEAQAGLHIGLAATIERHTHVDIGLMRHAMRLGRTLLANEQFGHLVPRHAVAVEYQGAAPHVACQLLVGLTVAYHVTATHVVGRVVHILLHHPRARLAGGCIIFGEMSVYELLCKRDALALKRLQHQLMHGPEGVLGKSIGAQSVLIGHHHEFVVGLPTNHSQITKHALLETQLLESVYLFVGGFFYQRPVAINE